jgi:hypothetical protein
MVKKVLRKGLGTEIIKTLIEFLEKNFTFEYILYPLENTI